MWKPKRKGDWRNFLTEDELAFISETDRALAEIAERQAAFDAKFGRRRQLTINRALDAAIAQISDDQQRSNVLAASGPLGANLYAIFYDVLPVIDGQKQWPRLPGEEATEPTIGEVIEALNDKLLTEIQRIVKQLARYNHTSPARQQERSHEREM